MLQSYELLCRNPDLESINQTNPSCFDKLQVIISVFLVSDSPTYHRATLEALLFLCHLSSLLMDHWRGFKKHAWFIISSSALPVVNVIQTLLPAQFMFTTPSGASLRHAVSLEMHESHVKVGVNKILQLRVVLLTGWVRCVGSFVFGRLASTIFNTSNVSVVGGVGRPTWHHIPTTWARRVCFVFLWASCRKTPMMEALMTVLQPCVEAGWRFFRSVLKSRSFHTRDLMYGPAHAVRQIKRRTFDYNLPW